jgi:subtilisin family serine protease
MTGEKITSTFPENQYKSFTGTSMAAPFATGTLALMLSYKNINKPDATIEMVLESLTASVAYKGSAASGREGDFGHIGIIDAYAAVEYLENYETKKNRLAEVSFNSGGGDGDDVSKCSNEVRLELATDGRGAETAYRLKRMSDDTVIWIEYPGSLEDNEKYSLTSCLDLDTDDCFRFDIRDTGGDGIAGEGMELYFRGHALYHGGNFGIGGSLTFGDNC